ncbi:MAG TPA: adenylate/guanylate cyclase domain-containing protein [Bradyrhizobium sp.]|uniref:AAA family ATPase n=1 Tax=Bradyrhizobium sp. TaxID=376 RepID=UPI002C8F9DE0|nr:adenylate/guanylate cyclase domain-containing protein [Bradyrhizobium sp.]HLZ01987.1 adenylate/guanylate cyclase domain-containing protein [Bradyrhizobium sp.]
MECAQCGCVNRRERRFCSGCGALLTGPCPACGFGNGVDEKFCGGCGAGLAAAALHLPPVLETERKYVTVLFADVRGSLEIIADRDPEEAKAVLDPVLERLVHAVKTFGGTVNRTIGDGIIALFGAPIAYEDHALRAASASLAMQQAVRELTQEPGWKSDVPVLVRIGLNSGEVVMRSSISGLPSDYSAVGETAHVASRVEHLAQPGTVALTAQTLKLLAGLVDAAPLGLFDVKGLAHPIELFRLLGVRAERSRIRGPQDRPLSRFVGRSLELGVLAETMHKARSGHGQLVAVVGEPGIGKSRMFLEFIRSPQAEGCLVLESGSEAFGPTSPMVPVIELARGYLNVERGDDPAAISAKLERRVEGIEAEDRDEIFNAFEALFLPDGDLRLRRSPGERQYFIVNGIAKALLRESRARPLVIVVEDLHWIDAASRSFIDTVIDRLRDSSILVLVSYRPDYQPDWGHRSYSQIRLERFSPAEVEAFLDALLGTDASLAVLKRDLELQTDGNALFLEESVHALVEAQILVGEPGAYRLVARPQEISVPASVQAVLAARIDRLPAEEKRILQCAAVIGRRVSYELLAEIAGAQPEALDRATDRLRAAEFLYEARRYPTREYVFKHALTHEVAYGTLLQERRRRLHTQIFHALEEAVLPDSFDRAEQLAHHAFRAQLWDKAPAYLRRAAANAVARSADTDAIVLLDQAVTALSHLPDEPSTLQQGIDVRLELRNALMPLVERARMFRTLIEAEGLARRLGDRRRLGWVSGYLTPLLWALGDYGRALETGQVALDTASAQNDAALEVIASRYLGHVHFSMGDYGQAVQRLQASLSSLQDDVIRQHFQLPYKSSIATSAWLVSSLAELGRFTEAIDHGRRGIAEAEAAGHAYSITAASCGLGLALLRRGELTQAIPVLERAAELTRSGDFAALSAWITGMLGHAYALAGKLDEARFLLEEGVARMSAMQVKIGEAAVIAVLGEACLLSGRRAEAMAHAERALKISRDRRERGSEAWALRLAGEIAAGSAETAAAISAFGSAISIADDLGMRPLLAHCNFGLGRLRLRAGEREAARTHLATALQLYRDMDMHHWLPQAEAAAAG